MNKKKIKIIAGVALFSILNQLLFPTVAFALTGGPSQPEVESFEPITTTQMVDPFSGDFNYNIPLMEVDGYPINIAYHSGISSDQEASWVGLGWNINPGVINRNLRGLPDDFDGSQKIKRIQYMKPNVTVGANFSLSKEFLGNKKIGSSTGNLSLTYNNYRGIGIGIGGNASSPSIKGKSLKIGFSASTQDGFSPYLNFSKSFANKSYSTNAGITFNSREGIKSISFGVGYNSKLKSRNGSGKKDLNDRNAFGSSYGFVAPTYTPSSKIPFSTFHGNFSLAFGKEIVGFSKSPKFGIQYSQQSVPNPYYEQSAIGYLYHKNIGSNQDALMDVAREKDGSISKETPNLYVPQSSFDLLSISGQGNGGTIRPYRYDIGYTRENHFATLSGFNGGNAKSASFGLEFGTVKTIKWAADLAISFSKGETGPWGNDLTHKKSGGSGPFDYVDFDPNQLNNGINDVEPVFYKLTGELTKVDQDYLPNQNLDKVLRPILEKKLRNVNVNNNTLTGFAKDGSEFAIPVNNQNCIRNKREVRSSFIEKKAYQDLKSTSDNQLPSIQYEYALNGDYLNISSIYKLIDEPASSGSETREITQLTPDGSLYVYGLPALNKKQIEISFTNSAGFKSDDIAAPALNTSANEVSYSQNWVSKMVDDPIGFAANPAADRKFNGSDQFLDYTETPAYAHSYLLTQVQYPGYVDFDDTKGPSDGDMGNYTLFGYVKIHSNYKWRSPVSENKANYQEGSYADNNDNSANMVYGEKEIWQLCKVEGRNHIAKFYMSKRKDGYGVKGINGGAHLPSGNNKGGFLVKLDSIQLIEKESQLVLKTAVFKYDYTLCKGINNSESQTTYGKLTLKSIYFKYGNSGKGEFIKYKFSYGNNKDYCSYAYDRWGNYNAPAINTNLPNNACSPTNGEFPYTTQEKLKADDYASAWNLNRIDLPSGGSILVEYESDDYAFVQNKTAMQMFKISGFGKETSSVPDFILEVDGDIAPLKVPAKYMFINLPSNYNINEFVDHALDGVDNLFFNCFVKLINKENGEWDYVKGYARPDYSDGPAIGIVPGDVQRIWIKIKLEPIDDIGLIKDHPIRVAAFNHLRVHLPYLIYPGSDMRKADEAGIVKLFTSLGSLILEATQFLSGSNINQRLKVLGHAKTLNLNKSWVRLNNTSGYKFGGGARVKTLTLNDNWNILTPNGSNQANKGYSQHFNYTTNDPTNTSKVISSGVASYEPLIGNEENPFRQPIFYDHKLLLVPDYKFYQEEPFGENFFPSAMVGYSKVSVSTVPLDGSSNAISNSGKVIHEFYTSYDFPTICKRTTIDSKIDQFSLIGSILHDDERRLSMSQGFQIELNDMHGKPKAEWNYSASQINSTSPNEALSGVTYQYNAKSLNAISSVLDNEVDVMNENGNIEKNLVGVESDIFIDTREENSETKEVSIMPNADMFNVATFFLFIPTLYFDGSYSRDNLKVITQSRVIQRYGILKSVTAFEEGAQLTSTNKVFDANTGKPLIVSTQNEFEDLTYNTTIPARFLYSGMGAKYSRQGLLVDGIKAITGGGFKIELNGVQQNPENYFENGDQVKFLKYSSANNVLQLYKDKTIFNVYKSDQGTWNFINYYGQKVELNPSESYQVKVINSALSNQLNTSAISFTSKGYPTKLEGVKTIINMDQSPLLQFSETEYNNHWPTFICPDIQNYFDLNNYAADLNPLFLALSDMNLFKIGEENDYQAIYGSQKKVKESNFVLTSSWINNHAYLSSTDLGDILIDEVTNYPLTKFNTQITSQLNSSLTHYDITFEYILTNGFNSSLFINGVLNFSIPISVWNDALSNGNQQFNFTDIQNIDVRPQFYFSGVKPQFKIGNDYISTAIDFSGSLFCHKSGRGFSYNNLLGVPVNPFNLGILGRWNPKTQYVFQELRSPRTRNNHDVSVRTDGEIQNFQSRWFINGDKFRPKLSINSNWQNTEITTAIDRFGSPISAIDPLGNVTSNLSYSKKGQVIGVAKNARLQDILIRSFENQSNTIECFNEEIHDYGFTSNAKKQIGNYAHTGSGVSLLSQTHNSIMKVPLITTPKINSPYAYYFGESDYYNKFNPKVGKYVVSYWVKAKDNRIITTLTDYTKLKVVQKAGTNPISTIDFKPEGPMIEGWQRVFGEFTISTDATDLELEFLTTSTLEIYMDDIRIQPYNSELMSYVYNFNNNTLIAILDENNYATYYEYDQELKLARVKKETENGIMMLKESRSTIKKNFNN